jgi:hypothetical protein
MKTDKTFPEKQENGPKIHSSGKTERLSLHQPTQKCMSIYFNFSEATVELLVYAIVMLATGFASRKG